MGNIRIKGWDSETGIPQKWDGSEWVEDTSGSSFQFPIGAVYLNITGTNPGTELGYGTWVRIAQSQFLVGQNDADADFDTAEETGGSKTINLEHIHGAGTLAADTATGNNKRGTTNDTLTQSHAHTISGSTDNQLSATQSILNPYFVIYAWKRTV